MYVCMYVCMNVCIIFIRKNSIDYMIYFNLFLQGLFQLVGLDGLSYGQITTSIYLKVCMYVCMYVCRQLAASEVEDEYVMVTGVHL